KDPRSDIALIQIQNPKNLTAIKLADSDALRVGDYTVAIGNPFMNLVRSVLMWGRWSNWVTSCSILTIKAVTGSMKLIKKSSVCL
ncbi:hypothetical protein MJN76_32745, partial [Salmonella enterica subsp. enterica serovar Anatum]|nr:hypothetical protein [Salmonella enterica subsp. enterica serovar Anatum]